MQREACTSGNEAHAASCSSGILSVWESGYAGFVCQPDLAPATAAADAQNEFDWSAMDFSAWGDYGGMS